MNTNGIQCACQSTPLPSGQPRATATPSGSADSANGSLTPTLDRVELSPDARPASETDPAGLDARIVELRRQIAAGTYLTSEKLDIAVDRLHAELLQRPAQ